MTITYFYALMTGVGIGTTVYVLAYLLGSGLFALIERAGRRKAQERRARIIAEVAADAEARRLAVDAQSDADFAIRLAELDARAAESNERMVRPEDTATV